MCANCCNAFHTLLTPINMTEEMHGSMSLMTQMTSDRLRSLMLGWTDITQHCTRWISTNSVPKWCSSYSCSTVLFSFLNSQVHKQTHTNCKDVSVKSLRTDFQSKQVVCMEHRVMHWGCYESGLKSLLQRNQRKMVTFVLCCWSGAHNQSLNKPIEAEKH